MSAYGDFPPPIQSNDINRPPVEDNDSNLSWIERYTQFFKDLKSPPKMLFRFHRREGNADVYRRTQRFRQVHSVPRLYYYIDDVPAPSFGNLQIFSVPYSAGFGTVAAHGKIFLIRSGLSSRTYSWEIKGKKHVISRVYNEERYLSDKVPSYVYYLELKGQSASKIHQFLEDNVGRTLEGSNYPKATFKEFANEGYITFTRPTTVVDRAPRAITAALASFVLFYSLPYILTGGFKCADFLSHLFDRIPSF
jgi:hypothetical protein